MNVLIYDPSGKYSEFYKEVIHEGCADAQIFISGNPREIYGQGMMAPVDLLIASTRRPFGRISRSWSGIFPGREKTG